MGWEVINVDISGESMALYFEERREYTFSKVSFTVVLFV